jgi:hypothetical protein
VAKVAMRADLIAPSDPRWADVLAANRHDLYHLPTFVEFATRWQEPGSPTAFVAREDDAVLFVPLIVRPIPAAIAGEESWFDATGPRGYPGPIGGGGTSWDDDFVERAATALAEALRSRRIVAAFVRCHPLLSPPLDTLRRHGTVVEHGESVSMDLSASPEQTWSGMRENHRRSITRARRDGYAMRIDESWLQLDAFLAAYAQAMERLGAEAHWRITRDYVLDLRAALGSGLHLAVVELRGELAAAALISEVDGIVEYHLAATAPAHATASPTKLLIEAASRWARERGNRVFHLAGSVRQDDALIHFKRGFSRLRHPVSTWRVVADRDAYMRLVAGWGHRGAATTPEADAGFFPAYRQPLTAEDRAGDDDRSPGATAAREELGT